MYRPGWIRWLRRGSARSGLPAPDSISLDEAIVSATMPLHEITAGAQDTFTWGVTVIDRSRSPESVLLHKGAKISVLLRAKEEEEE